MRYAAIRDIVIRILSRRKNDFQIYRTAYQIVEIIKKEDPRLYEIMRRARGTGRYGKGADVQYSIATYVAKACRYFQQTDRHFRMVWVDALGSKYFNKKPGFPSFISSWTYQE